MTIQNSEISYIWNEGKSSKLKGWKFYINKNNKEIYLTRDLVFYNKMYSVVYTKFCETSLFIN